MRKRTAVMAMSLGLALAIPAQAEMWTCEYDGSWTTFNSSDKGKFNWSVVWQGKAGGGWTITGDYADRYGQSVLNGDCDDRACSLVQEYQSGQLKGKRYFWKGNYTDQSVGGAQTVNRFGGTWGSAPSARDGAWQALATCTRT